LGTIWEELDADIDRSDFMSSVGLSFALDTVLGPISLTYGHVFAGSRIEGRDQIYFNLGHRF
jgi:outer membrane protein assembly factor BamA